MSPMGSQGYSSAGQTQLSAKVDESLKLEFQSVCDSLDRTMTDAIEEQMREFVARHGDFQPDGPGEYYPDDQNLRSLYEACLDVADEKLKVYQRRHASLIAEQTGQVKAANLPDALVPLREKGYVARGFMPIDIVGDDYDRWLHWYVKPICADPMQWVKREESHE